MSAPGKREELAKSPRNRQSTLADVLPVGSQAKSRFKESTDPRVTHGGAPSLKKRKTPRPFTGAAPLHLVMRSKRARGSWSLLHRKNKAQVLRMIYVYADRFQVRVHRAANTGNHLHLLVKASEKKQLADFLRVLAGRIAVTITGAKKGVKRIGKFWDYLYWSKLVNWGHEFFETGKMILKIEKEKLSDFVNEEWDTFPDPLVKGPG